MLLSISSSLTVFTIHVQMPKARSTYLSIGFLVDKRTQSTLQLTSTFVTTAQSSSTSSNNHTNPHIHLMELL